MPMTPKQIIKLLLENGFEFTRQVGSHRRYKNPKTGIATTVPMHAKDLKKGTEQAILKETGLKK